MGHRPTHRSLRRRPPVTTPAVIEASRPSPGRTGRRGQRGPGRARRAPALGPNSRGPPATYSPRRTMLRPDARRTPVPLGRHGHERAPRQTVRAVNPGPLQGSSTARSPLTVAPARPRPLPQERRSRRERRDGPAETAEGSGQLPRLRHDRDATGTRPGCDRRLALRASARTPFRSFRSFHSPRRGRGGGGGRGSAAPNGGRDRAPRRPRSKEWWHGRSWAGPGRSGHRERRGRSRSGRRRDEPRRKEEPRQGTRAVDRSSAGRRWSGQRRTAVGVSGAAGYAQPVT